MINNVESDQQEREDQVGDNDIRPDIVGSQVSAFGQGPEVAYHTAEQEDAVRDDGGEPERPAEEYAEHTDQTKGHIRDAHFILERTARLPADYFSRSRAVEHMHKAGDQGSCPDGDDK